MYDGGPVCESVLQQESSQLHAFATVQWRGPQQYATHHTEKGFVILCNFFFNPSKVLHPVSVRYD